MPEDKYCKNKSFLAKYYLIECIAYKNISYTIVHNSKSK